MKNRRFTILMFFGASLFLFISCSQKIHQTVTEGNLIIFPAPPDTTRIQFLTKISTSRDIEGEQSKFVKFIVGENKPIAIGIPYGIAISKGVLYVCDIGINAIWEIDLNNRTFSLLPTHGLGELQNPINCFVDDDIIYCADGKRKQVVLFDRKGEYIRAWGEKNNFKPSDVYVYNQRIYISDMSNNRINVYDRNTFDLISYFPNEKSPEEERLFLPTNICVIENKLYVSNFGDSKIKIYSLDGKYIKTIGSYGENTGQFVRPKGIAGDKMGNLYVVDAASEFAQVFDNKGQLLLFFGGPYKGPGDMFLPAKVIVDYDNLAYFEKYVYEGFKLKYLIFVTNQYGPDKIGVYGAIELKE